MDLPEIRIFVGALLDNHNLTVCARVSQGWCDSFTPFLYSKALACTTREHWPFFQNRLCHIRDLEISSFAPSHQRSSIVQQCTQLMRLQMALNVFPRDTEYLSSLLKRNSSLVRLGITMSRPLQLLGPEIVDTIGQHCRWVTELSLSSMVLEGEVLDRLLLNLAPRLTSLKMEWCRPFHRSNSWKDWPAFPKLRDLDMVSRPDIMPWEDQLRLFSETPKLEALSWGLHHHADPVMFMETLSSFLQQGRWPRLDSIRLTESRSDRRSRFSDAQLARILRNCPERGLRRLTLPTASFKELAWAALQRHLPTVRVLHLSTQSWMIQEILTSCPELREFEGATLRAFELVDGFGAEKYRADAIKLRKEDFTDSAAGFLNTSGDAGYEDYLRANREVFDTLSSMTLLSTPLPPPRPWVCHKLRVLRVLLWKMSEIETSVQVFEQLTKLRCLQELHLRTDDQRDPHGLDKITLSHMGLEDSEKFTGEYPNAWRIRQNPVGRRLLEIWPGLTSCNLIVD